MNPKFLRHTLQMTGSRLAIQSLDWENLDAQDIFVVACSFADPSFTVSAGADASRVARKMLARRAAKLAYMAQAQAGGRPPPLDERGVSGRRTAWREAIVAATCEAFVSLGTRQPYVC